MFSLFLSKRGTNDISFLIVFLNLSLPMGEYGGQGPMINAVLWVEVVVGVIFVGLRLYTRKVILNSIGWDDYLGLAALVRIHK